MTAASAEWLLQGEPIFVDGNAYYRAGPDVFFDGDTMARTGVYRTVPVYQDRTIEPHSIIYVPVGRTLMRPYERRRSGELGGTSGSRTPSFPVQRSEEVPRAPVTGLAPSLGAAASESERPVGTVGVLTTRTPPTSPSSTAGRRLVPRSLPRPTGNDGIWIQFSGARWFVAGPVVSYSADRFVPAGAYRGFPVYRAKNGGDEIFIPAVTDGPLTPYTRR